MLKEHDNLVVSIQSGSPSVTKGVRLNQTMRPYQIRRRVLFASFLLCVIVPTFFGGAYFLFVASDKYVADAGFTVRSIDAGRGADLFGTFTGIANAGSTTSDSYILLKYLKSRSIVEKLEHDFPLRKTYASEDVDFLSRLSPQIDIERLVDYWDRVISTTYDNISGVITFDISAFRPQDAKRIAELVLQYSNNLVNDISERARGDAVAFAQGEVDRAEARLRIALEKLRNFRNDEKSIDPAKSAQVQIEIVGALEKQLLETQARIAVLEGTVDDNSPSLKVLKRQAEAIEAQIASKQGQISNGNTAVGNESAALSGLLATYETLEVERSFAQQAYASALSSLEKARVEAGRQQRYLAVYQTPAAPEYPLYPRRVLNVVLLALISSAIWGIGSLIVYSVRDHLS